MTCFKSIGGGQTISSTVTPAGASILTVVGINDGSRGLFDCVWSPSGTETLTATRAADPARADPSTSGNTSALGRVERADWALAANPPVRKTNAKTRNRFTSLSRLSASIHFL